MEQCGEICFYKNYQDNSFSFHYSLSLLNKIRTEKKEEKKQSMMLMSSRHYSMEKVCKAYQLTSLAIDAQINNNSLRKNQRRHKR